MNQNIQLIVGLGNPGAQYDQTRHNVGADAVAQLAQQQGSQWQLESKFHGYCSSITLLNHPIRLLIPNTFMNLSGKAVGAMAQFYKIPTHAILVAHDELDLNPGIAKFKKAGGHGGHNGLRDIIRALGNQNDFYRLRLGIGHPGHASLVSNFVLGRAPQSEQQLVTQAIEHALECLPLACTGEWEKAMHQLHSER